MADGTDFDVAVVGGGPAGALLALLLARRGVRALLLEKHADFHREYRGEVLAPRFTRLLRQLRLEHIVDALPHRRLEAAQVHWMNRPIAQIRFDRVSPEIPYALWIPQPALLGALAAEGAKHAAHALWFDATVRELIRDGERVAGVVVERDSEKIPVRCRVVVGADGRFSSLRRLGKFEVEYERHDFDILWFTIKEPPGQPAAFRAYLTPPRGYLALPKHPNLVQCGMLLPPNGLAWYREHGIESLKAHLSEGPDFIREFVPTVHDFTPFTLLRANLDLVKDWERDGLVLIGDAAHTCSPAGAIGVAIAAETAAVAAEVLLDCFARGDFSKSALDRIQQRREPAIREIHRRQIRLGGLINSQSPLARRMAPYVLPIVSRLGIIERFMRPLVVGAPLELRDTA